SEHLRVKLAVLNTNNATPVAVLPVDVTHVVFAPLEQPVESLGPERAKRYHRCSVRQVRHEGATRERAHPERSPVGASDCTAQCVLWFQFLEFAALEPIEASHHVAFARCAGSLLHLVQVTVAQRERRDYSV